LAVASGERADHTATLAQHTLAYGLSGFVVPLVGLVTLPIYSRVFSPAEYGLLELGIVVTSIGLVLADGGLSAGAQRNFYEYRPDQVAERRNVLFTALVATFALGLLVAAVLILLRGTVAERLLERPGEKTLVAVVATTIPAITVATYFREIMRLGFRTGAYLVSSALTAFLTGALGVFAVVALDLDVEGVFVGTLVAALVAVAYGAIAIRGDLVGRFSRRELAALLAYGLPLVPAAITAWVLLLVDRVILRSLEDLDAVGQYAIASRLSGVLALGMTAFILALGPYLLSVYSQSPEQEKAVRGRTLTYLAFVLGLGALTLTLFAEDLTKVIAPDYEDAHEAVGPLAFGAIGYGAASILLTGISLARKTMHVALLSTIAGAANILLNLALIPPLGIVGAGLASAGGYGLLAALYYWAAQRVYPTPFEPRRVLTIVVLAAAAASVVLLPVDGPPAVALHLLAIAAFVGAVVAVGAMRSAEFRELGRFVRGMIPALPRYASRS
jgi:O-antigen/teichoic acid export membrane protein